MSACTRSHIVTGTSSSGIGRATALHLAAAGHHVSLGSSPSPRHSCPCCAGRAAGSS
jgi:NAD(P)-dependent dehydrogenase (short-subunit alcohol dehydrogenase family)